ncbi:hypothetical protein DB347_22730 [Opitutaceae bacterium EW11]|nr:hypothetical protein DB347_22730 [Opitutaceae bacterium EW11]
MERGLSPEEKRLVEREFIARQEVAARRRVLYRRVFIVGIVAAVLAAALREFRVPTLITPALGFLWLACLLAYAGLAAFPSTFVRDLDFRWHSNPWQEALNSLASGKTQFEAIALLVSPYLGRLLFSFIYAGFMS